MTKQNPNNLFTYRSAVTKPGYRSDEPVYYLIGTPFHSNIGDRAIAYAEIDFIQYVDNKRMIVEVPFGEDLSGLDIRDQDTIILHGGGNFGDIWPAEEEYRRKVIENNINRKIILMPQTMFFSDDEYLKSSVELYSGCRNLTLIAREQISYDLMRREFQSNRVMFIPDIVLSLKYQAIKQKVKRDYALFVVRNDIEKTTPDSYIHRTEDVLKYESSINNFVYSDMHCDIRESMINSHKFITEYKLNQFKGARIVVTDRLHGMIFAAITSTPCLVFGSKTQKTKGVYDMIKSTRAGRYIQMCDNESDISQIVEDLVSRNPRPHKIRDFDKDWASLADLISLS